MKNHIHVLSILLIVVSIFWMFLGLFLTVGITFIPTFTESLTLDSKFNQIIHSLGTLSNVIAYSFIFLSLLGISSAIGLLMYNQVARIIALFLFVLSLFNFPIGTCISAYGIYVLINDEVIELFNKKK